jgi:hypothetical protein
VLKNSGRHFVVTLTCGFFTSGYLERFPSQVFALISGISGLCITASHG